jgi:hypothetical protein
MRSPTPLPPRDLPSAATGAPGDCPAGGALSDADFMPVDGVNTSQGCRVSDDAAFECGLPPRVNDEPRPRRRGMAAAIAFVGAGVVLAGLGVWLIVWIGG